MAEIAAARAAPSLPRVGTRSTSTSSANGFKRLGVNADWEHPYLTYHPELRGRQRRDLQVIMYLKGSGLPRPQAHPLVQEAATRPSPRRKSSTPTRCRPSVYVKFKLDAMPGVFEAAGADWRRLRPHLDHHALDPSGQRRRVPGARRRIRHGPGRRLTTLIIAKELVEQVAEIGRLGGSTRFVCGADGQPVALKGTRAVRPYLYLPHPPGPQG